MDSIADFLKRTSERNGFIRDRFEEKKIPTDFSQITIFPFFGDLRSTCIASSFILNRYRLESKSSKYFILASWPGFQGLFPYVDEYWSINDLSHIKKFYEKSSGFNNTSDLHTIYLRNFNEFFRDVVDYREISAYYENGFKNKFFQKYKDTKRFLPFVPSAAILGKDFNRDVATYPGYKIFIYPSLFCTKWSNGQTKNINTKREFWIDLLNKLLESGYTPVVWQNNLSHDVSKEFIGRCVITTETDVTRVLAAMRATGIVLDVFNSLSRLALLARCPYLSVDERSRYYSQKEYEIDDLFSNQLQKYHFFTFSSIISEGNSSNWNGDIFKILIFKLDKILPSLDRDSWPTTGESTELVPYDKEVRHRVSKKMGIKFVRIPKD